ncbi:hypothetical protein [Meiothermus sp.]|uniref:hypothetical protein n=1 Tax=Meiothermus sp. TaxID=1955249 RepID=UPI0026363D93|nr:hypothetical protein [Meiothermus sp.]
MKKLIIPISLVFMLGFAQEQPQVFGDARFVERQDVMTDEDRSSVVISELAAQPNATLIWRCRGDRLEVLVFAGEILDSNSNRLFFRSDKGAAAVIVGSLSTNRRAVFINNSDHKMFTQAVLGTKNIFAVRFGFLENEAFTYQFRVSGLADALARLKCYKQ